MKKILTIILFLELCCGMSFGQGITLKSNLQITASNMCQGKVKHAIYHFQLKRTSGGATFLNKVKFTTNSGYNASDVSKFQLWHNDSSNFSTATQLGPNKLDSLGPGTRELDSLSFQINNPDSQYFWICTDIQASATSGNTISVQDLVTADLIFSTAVTLNDSSTAGGVQTIVLLPVCSVSGSNAVCASSSGNSYSGPAGMTAYSWGISGNGTIVGASTNQSVSVTAGAAGTYTLSLTIANANNCSSTCQQVITVNSNPTCSITGNTAVCATSTGNSYSGPAGMTSYSWSISGNGTIVGASTNQSVSVTAGAAGTYTLTLTITNANNCSNTCQQAVTVNSNPTCSITGSAAVCAASTGNSYSGPAGMTSYSWSISGNGNIIGASTNQSVSVTALAAGTYTLTLTIINANSCSSTCSQAVTVNANPTCSITGSTAVCAASTGNSYSGPAGMNSYSWSITGNGTIVGASTNQSVSVTAGAAGTYTLTLTIINANSCSNTCSQAVTVNASPTCNITGNDTVCENSIGNSYSGPPGMSSYSWGISGNGTIIGATTNQSASIDAGVGNFTLTLTIINANSCSSSCQQQVAISNPSCSISGGDTLCETSSGNIFTAPGGMSGYAWSIIGTNAVISGASNAQSVSITSGLAGTFTLSLTITDANSCSSTCQLLITVANPPCSISGLNFVCSNSVSNIYNGIPGMTGYSWGITGNGVITGATNGQSVVVNAGAPGTYTLTLTLTDANSCSSTCQKSVTVNANPACSISGSNAVCENINGLNYTGTSSMSIYSWSISGNGTISGASNIQTVIVNSGSSGTYTLTSTITDANSCTSTCQQIVTVNGTPTCLITGSNSVCESSLNNTYSGPAGMVAYSWAINGNALINGATNGQTVSVNAGLAGFYGLTLTITDANSCTNSCTTTTTVKPLPQNVNIVSPTGDQIDFTVCSGSENIPYSLDVAQSATVSWSGNLTNVTFANTNAINNVITFPDSSVSYNANISVTIQGINGCSNTTTFSVLVSTSEAPDAAPITKKDIGNGPILIYTDPSVRGFRWGYDSVPDASTGPILNSSFISGQVYQAFVPGGQFLNGTSLDENNYWYWVMVYDNGSANDTCKTRVYYNGPLSRTQQPFIISSVDLIASVVPNPNDGNFMLQIEGTVLGRVSVVIYNMIGDEKSFSVVEKVSEMGYLPVELKHLAAGLYSAVLTAENGAKSVVKFIVNN